MADIQSPTAEIRRGKKERRKKKKKPHRAKILAATLRGSRPGGAIRIAHYDVSDDVITRKLQQIEKNEDHLPHEIL